MRTEIICGILTDNFGDKWLSKISITSNSFGSVKLEVSSLPDFMNIPYNEIIDEDEIIAWAKRALDKEE